MDSRTSASLAYLVSSRSQGEILSQKLRWMSLEEQYPRLSFDHCIGTMQATLHLAIKDDFRVNSVCSLTLHTFIPPSLHFCVF